MNLSSKNELAFDIQRSLILSKYIESWGQPFERTISINDETKHRIEVYVFIDEEIGIHRFATIGVSIGSLKTQLHEFLFCFNLSFDQEDRKKTVDYILDISVYSQKDEVKIDVGYTVPCSPLAPNYWRTRALLFDEARCEDEHLSSIHVGDKNVELLWVVPITENERKFIQQHKLECFDDEVKGKFEFLLDVKRDSLV